MLNQGTQKPWEPSRDEIISTVMKLSQLGLAVYCTGAKIANLMTSAGFQIRRFENGELFEVITEFTDKGILTLKIIWMD